MAREIGVNT